jgi:hypothetical protein
MKKPKLEKRVRPSVKATVERLAQEDDRSLAHWLERLIEAEGARQDRKKVGPRGRLRSTTCAYQTSPTTPVSGSIRRSWRSTPTPNMRGGNLGHR